MINKMHSLYWSEIFDEYIRVLKDSCINEGRDVLCCPHYTYYDINNISIHPDCKHTTYLTNARYLVCQDIGIGVYSADANKYRYACKPGKLLRKILCRGEEKADEKIVPKSDNKVNDTDIEFAVKVFNKFFTSVDESNIKILPPNKVCWAYHVKNYYTESGELGSSCMRHPKRQKQIKFYEKNNVSIAVLLIDNKVAGRALIWDNCIDMLTGESVTFMDRIYATKDIYRIKFEKFAAKKQFLTKNDISKNKIHLCRKMKNMDDPYFPFMDTISLFYYNNNLITNKVISANSLTNNAWITNILKKVLNTDYTDLGSYIHLVHTDGYFPQACKNLTQDNYSKLYFPKRFAIKTEKYGIVDKRNLVTIVDSKGIDCDEIYHINDPEIVELKSYKYALKKDCVCDSTGQYILKYNASPVYSIKGSYDEPYLYLWAYTDDGDNWKNKMYTGHNIHKNSDMIHLVIEVNGKFYFRKDVDTQNRENSNQYYLIGNRKKWYKDRPLLTIPPIENVWNDIQTVME